MDVRDNPYYQALAAVVTELQEMGVDLDELQKRVNKGLQEGREYAFKDKARALGGIEALKDAIFEYQLHNV